MNLVPAIDTSSGFLVLGIAAVVAYVTLLWVALAFWMVRDARRRTDSWVFALFAFTLGLALPFLGVLIYLVVRPPLTLDEERALQLEEKALTEAPPDEKTRPCPTCGREIEREFVICPYCRTQFARRCHTCQHWLRLGWRVCPYCAEEVGLQSIPEPGRAVGS
jgi:RNA polymerase subunit RPABC4/transcription elongation factor Spt4